MRRFRRHRSIEVAWEEGRRAGRREVLPFEDIPRILAVTEGTRFEFRRSWFDSYLSYERRAREDLRRVQREGWRATRLLRDARSDASKAAHRDRLFALRRLQRFVADQVRAAAEAVDAELAEGRGRSCIAEAMRQEPRRPPGVRELPTLEAFIAEDRRRAVPGWPQHHDAGGEDHGHEWRLENPTRPWLTSRWRVSWLCTAEPTYELYALELLPPGADGDRRTGRVWTLGQLRDRSTVQAALEELHSYAMGERNSLVSAAKAVRSAMHP